jgi:hypothetical protein
VIPALQSKAWQQPGRQHRVSAAAVGSRVTVSVFGIFKRLVMAVEMSEEQGIQVDDFESARPGMNPWTALGTK